MKTKVAVITGISGQDGSYLAELLLSKGYKVVGVLRRHSSPEHQTSRLDSYGLRDKVDLVYGDVTDLPSLLRIFSQYKPDEIYNLAAQAHVKISFDQPSYTTDSIVFGTLNVLEAAKAVCPEARIYLAGSSEMYGNERDPDGFRRESTKMIPVSPYGCAKLYGFNLGKVYRESYGMFICNGILFNHESPRRGLNFVTNKVVEGAVKISKGLSNSLALGNLKATRDWGHAKDYVKAMWLMLQKDKPDDYVCSTGESRSIEELCEIVFSNLKLNYKDYVRVDPKYFRPLELDDLKGDCQKARKELNWVKEYTFYGMILEMINYWNNKLNLKIV
jgi:GDPmannose 4,6-dehydratase